jgi:hypothetical protein
MKDRYPFPLKSTGWGWLTLLFLVVTFALQLPLQVSASNTSCQVDYINKRLTVKVDNVALGTVLAAIREKTGIEFVLSQEISEVPISIQLGPLAVVEGLKRILSHSNHAFIFGTNNKLIKVVILNYSTLNSSPRTLEGAETPSAQRVISPFPAEIQDTKPTAKDGRIVPSSSEIMNINQPIAKDMIPTPSSEKMVTKLSSGEDMIVRLSSEAIAIRPTVVLVEDMMIPTPPDVIASKVKNMIIGGFTEESKPKPR